MSVAAGVSFLKKCPKKTDIETYIKKKCKYKSSGVYKNVYIFPNFVIKVSNRDALYSEVRSIKKLRKTKWRKYFPPSRLYKGVEIQTRVNTIGSSLPDYPHYQKRVNSIRNEIERKLKYQIIDLHEDNWGLDSNGELVIFDVHFSGDAFPQRSD